MWVYTQRTKLKRSLWRKPQRYFCQILIQCRDLPFSCLWLVKWSPAPKWALHFVSLMWPLEEIPLGCELNFLNNLDTIWVISSNHLNLISLQVCENVPFQAKHGLPGERTAKQPSVGSKRCRRCAGVVVVVGWMCLLQTLHKVKKWKLPICGHGLAALRGCSCGFS